MHKPYIVPGIHSVFTVITRKPERLLEVFVEADYKNERITQIETLCTRNRISCQHVQRERLDRMCEGVQHQGVAARCAALPSLTESDLKAIIPQQANPLLLALDEVSDPHNLGACLRSAEAAGAHAVILTSHKSASLTPTVRKVSCGASELIPIIRVPNLVRCIEQLKPEGIWVVGASAASTTSLFDCDLHRPTLLVMGAEGTGLRRLTEDHCDLLASIPIVGGVESLNVSVATGICLYEAIRQRQCRPATD